MVDSISKGVRKVKLVGLVVAFCLLSSVSLAKKAAKPGKKSTPSTQSYIETQGGNISFTCSPTNCREQEDGSLLFNLSCQTNKENDKLEVYLGDKSQTIQSSGFVTIPEDIKAPKKGFVPIKISVSEDGNLPKRHSTFKYTVEQVKRPTCRKHGDIEL